MHVVLIYVLNSPGWVGPYILRYYVVYLCLEFTGWVGLPVCTYILRYYVVYLFIVCACVETVKSIWCMVLLDVRTNTIFFLVTIFCFKGIYI